MTLERRLTDRLQVGIDYLPSAGEATPRAVYRLGEPDSWSGFLGLSSTRTSSEDGEFGGFATVGFGQRAWGVYAGAFVEFGGTARAVAGGRLDIGLADLEPYYDGQFVHLGLSRSFGDTRVGVARSGTGRFSLSVSRALGRG